MQYRLLADAVMLVHFGFLAFVALGGFVAWRYRWAIGAHALAVAWGLVSALGLAPCPLTAWEDGLRRLAGEPGLPRGFIDTYLTGVVYPREHLLSVQFLVGGLVAASWAGFVLFRNRAAFLAAIASGATSVAPAAPGPRRSEPGAIGPGTVSGGEQW